MSDKPLKDVVDYERHVVEARLLRSLFEDPKNNSPATAVAGRSCGLDVRQGCVVIRCSFSLFSILDLPVHLYNVKSRFLGYSGNV